MIVTRIRPLSLARVTATVSAATVLLMGSIFAVASFFGIATHAREEPWLGAAVGVLAIIAAPIFYGLLGFLGGLFIAAVHNVTARAMGGVELEVRDR